MCLSFNLLATFWLMAIYHWKNDETCELGHLDGDLTEMICNPNGLSSCSACLSFLNPSIFQQTSRLQGVHN